MTDFFLQIERIKEKLKEARQIDGSCQVFGAGSHRYTLYNPVSEEDIAAFESSYQVGLPECYKAFLLHIGNGGPSYLKSAAGPFYGIYPFTENIDELVCEPEKYLSRPVQIYPKMTDEYWDTLTNRIFTEEDISDEDYETEKGHIAGGILPIGSQGCTYLHALVLNGPHKGMVVNMDMDFYKPRFAFEANFLDWYERWLDEVISGELRTNEATWFGYSMGGSEDEILAKYQAVDADEIDKSNCLIGLLSKKSLRNSSLIFVENELTASSGLLKDYLLSVLTKFDYTKAKPLLVDFSESNFNSFIKILYWYAQKRSLEWVEIIENHLIDMNDAEAFRFAIHVLDLSKYNKKERIAPFLEHENEEIAKEATAWMERQL